MDEHDLHRKRSLIHLFLVEINLRNVSIGMAMQSKTWVTSREITTGSPQAFLLHSLAMAGGGDDETKVDGLPVSAASESTCAVRRRL